MARSLSCEYDLTIPEMTHTSAQERNMHAHYSALKYPLNHCLGSGSVGFAKSLDPYPQKYADPRIRIQGAKYQPKTAKNKHILLSKSKSELLIKEKL